MNTLQPRLLVMLLLAGCSNRLDPFGQTARYITSAGDAPGYQHTVTVSKFAIGTNVKSMQQLGKNKFVGSDGTFATDPVTGAVAALPNAGAPATMVPAVADPAAHNAQVTAYFESCGLPADQISGAHILTEMASGGPPDQPAPVPQFVGYTSVLERSLAGVRVEDSFAWARFNTKGEVVMESVYWPPIKAGVIAEPQAFQSKLADANARAQYLASLPAGRLGNGSVAIRHTSSLAHVPFVARVSFDVVYGSSTGRRQMRHFDADGKELTDLPSGVPTLSNTPKH